MNNRAWVSIAITGLCSHSVRAQFSGPYAPSNWTFNPNGGDGSVVVSGAPAEITLIGNDNGQPNINTDYTVVVVASGFWSFSWQTIPMDKGDFDAAYYLINGTQHFIGFNSPPNVGSFQDIPVLTGDVIGFRVWSFDGALGELSLKITTFDAPVPSPAGITAMFGLGLWIGLRRRRAGP